MERKLRRYQERCVDNFLAWYNTSSSLQSIHDRLATIILAMGLGKTFTSITGVQRLYQSGKRIKVLWAVHREELVNQARDEFLELIPDANIQVEIAENRATSDAEIIVGSVQTLSRTRKNIKEFEPDLIIVDEWHHYHEKNNQYHGLLEKYSNAKILGLTATPYRFMGGELPVGQVLINVDISKGIQHGYLCKPRPETVYTNTSIANVSTRAGDFAIDELSHVVNNNERNKLICDRLVKAVKEEGRMGILYAASVEHSKSLCKLLQESGIRVVELYGDTPKDERREIMRKIHNKEVDIVTNNLILTEGTNIPHVNMICVARPTKSFGLYSQAIGRGLRLYYDKEDCLIIDIFDKVKVTQGIASFSKVISKSKVENDIKRLKHIINEEIADSIRNFPVVMKISKNDI